MVNAAGRRRAVDWRFNAYGGCTAGLYSPWDQDDLRATLAEAVDVSIAVEAAEAAGRRALKSDAAVVVVGEAAAARGLREVAAGAYALEEAADAEAASAEATAMAR